MVDYRAIKTADAILGINDPGQAASTLNTQNVATVVDVSSIRCSRYPVGYRRVWGIGH